MSARIVRANSFVFFVAFALLTLALVAERNAEVLIWAARALFCGRQAETKLEGAPQFAEAVQRAANGEEGGLQGPASYRVSRLPEYAEALAYVPQAAVDMRLEVRSGSLHCLAPQR